MTKWHNIIDNPPPKNTLIWGYDIFYGRLELVEWCGGFTGGSWTKETGCTTGTTPWLSIPDRDEDDFFFFYWKEAKIPRRPSSTEEYKRWRNESK